MNNNIRSTVSVIIPSHNRRHTLPLALESMQGQIFPHWECLVIDDNSDDDTQSLTEAYQQRDARFRYLKMSPGQSGANRARNLGVQESHHAYVLFLDSDDALAASCLQARVTQMETQPHLDFGVWPTLLFENTPGDSTLLWNVASAEDDLNRFLALDIPWQTAGVLWRRTALDKMGPWNEQLPSWQDWEFHLRALATGLTYRKFEKPDSYWRTPRSDSIGKHSYQIGHLDSRRRLLADIEDILRREDKWGEKQKRLMVGLYFWHARLWYSKLRNRFKGLSEWHAAWRRGLVKTGPFLQGCRWFSKLTRGFAKDPRIFFHQWPEEYLAGSSKTFQTVHYRAL